MSNRDSTKQRWYAALWKAYEDSKPTDSVTSAMGELSVDQAYDVQAMLVENKIRRGERIIGWKVGCTSRATMDQLNIDEPIFGCMTSGSHYSSLRGIKASDFCKLGIEGEIAFVMDRPLKGPGITPPDVIMAASGIMGAVELVDSRIRGWKMNISEAIADNSLHAGVILGAFMRPISGFDLKHEGVVICKNGRLLASGCGVEALGNPVNVVAWLANTLSAFDREIKAGEIILTGSLTKFFFVEAGDVLDVSFSNLGSIQFSIGD
jgi:2-keto-4-pentenoate hydratase